MASPSPPAADARAPRLDRRLALLALLAFALAFQGSRGIWDPDEGRYTNVALRMLRGGDWLTPTLHPDVPHFTKPPLTYWAIAGSVELLGRNEWAVRLPNALAFVLTVLLVGRMAHRLAPGREDLAAVVQATSLFPFVAANIVTTDTLLTHSTTLAAAAFVEWRFGPRRRVDLLMMSLGFGLAFLTKGPPGLLPLLPILALTLRFDGPRGAFRLLGLRGLAIFAVVGLGWYAIEILRYPDLLAYLLGSEVAGRVASHAFDRNATLLGLVRAYLPVILAGGLPWMPWAVARALRARRTSTRETPPDSAGWFLAAWLVLPAAVFFLSASRQPLYLLQLTPAASLLMARALPADALASRRRRYRLATWVVTLLALKAAAAWIPTDRDGRRLAERLAHALPRMPRELAIVQRKPPYSLSFYLDVDIEAVKLESVPGAPEAPSFRPVFEPLSAELADPELGRVWLVAKHSEDVFLDELRALGWHAHPTGEVEDLVIFDDPDHGAAP